MYGVSRRISGCDGKLGEVVGTVGASSRERYALGPPSETGGQIIDPKACALREFRESTILINSRPD